MANKRVIFAPKEDTLTMMRLRAKRDKVSLSRVTQALVEQAIEQDEEMWLWKVAQEAEKASEGKPTYRAEDIWKELNIK